MGVGGVGGCRCGCGLVGSLHKLKIFKQNCYILILSGCLGVPHACVHVHACMSDDVI